MFDSTVSDAEKQLVIALAAADLPVPTVGYETDDGEVVDFAWGDVRIGVLLDPDDDTANTMSETGVDNVPTGRRTDRGSTAEHGVGGAPGHGDDVQAVQVTEKR